MPHRDHRALSWATDRHGAGHLSARLLTWIGVVGCEILKLTEMLAANCQRVPHGTAMLPSVGSVLDEREPVVRVVWLRATVGGEFGKKWAAFW